MKSVISSDETRISYEERGNGPPLLLIHGSAVSRTHWYPSVSQYEERFSVYLVDRRGRGNSEDAEEYSFERELEDIEAVIDDIGEPVHLFGHSFGGLCALEVARRVSEERISRLVLYEPSILVSPHDHNADLASYLQELVDSGEEQKAKHLFFEEAAGMEGEIPPPAKKVPARTIARESEVVEEYDLVKNPEIEVPTLLIKGEEGPEHLRDAVDAINETVTTSEVFEVSETGHAGSTKDSVTRRVINFLDRDI